MIFATTNNQAFAITNDLINYRTWNEEELMQRHENLVQSALMMFGLAQASGWQTAAE